MQTKYTVNRIARWTTNSNVTYRRLENNLKTLVLLCPHVINFLGNSVLQITVSVIMYTHSRYANSHMINEGISISFVNTYLCIMNLKVSTKIVSRLPEGRTHQSWLPVINESISHANRKQVNRQKKRDRRGPARCRILQTCIGLPHNGNVS